MKNAEDYLDLPYHYRLVRSETGEGEAGWFAEVEELPGCMSQGETPAEAIERVQDAMLGWISVAIEDGIEIPTPRPETATAG
jgi:antitoxin HicB